jgi:hypothetical protein
LEYDKQLKWSASRIEAQKEESMLKMVLVTGSTGSKTVKFLLDAGARVRAFVHSEDERSPLWPPRVPTL